MSKGHENLIPINQRTPEEIRRITSKAGIASGESKRRTKTFKDIFEKLLKDEAIDGSNITNDELLALQMLKEANKGNTKAFEIVRDTIGQRPVDKKEVDSNITGSIEITEEDRELLKNISTRIKDE